ncbi:hypothetical protein BV898_15237 [Hypsibius exemplaris]|uniref:Cystatin domain-containing protein n=1 Tax=Hypsibius exemplaris TaxID=2072580 RepID=A0A9X6NA92_HYPEX|nr:hypothetical protein BV898_15237 [Hypsibius exemplaris]
MSDNLQEAEGAGHAGRLVGGNSHAKEANSDAQAIADAVRGDVEKHLGGGVKEFVVEQFKTQVVAGINYSLKVRIDLGKYIHIKVFKGLGGKEPQLSGIEKNKSSGDEIGHISAL